jgi:hypothetical protein
VVLGYHGTSLEAAKEIIQTGAFTAKAVLQVLLRIQQ